MQTIVSSSSVDAPQLHTGQINGLAGRGIRCPSDVLFAFGVSLTWLLFYNARFWQEAVQAMWHGNASSAVFFLSLFVVVLCLQALLLLLLPTRRLMVGVAGGLFLVAALGSYFTSRYGVVMNKDMLRNVFETNAAESRSLLSPELMARFVLMGVVPAVLAWKVRPARVPWTRSLRARALALLGIGVACTLALLSSSASYAVFFREHKLVRFTLSPTAPITSAFGLFWEEHKNKPGPVVNMSGPALRNAASNGRPLLVLLVIGETARAQNFQLGGYHRPTNPALAAVNDLVYFPNTTACGTATAFSVPCLFSHLGRTEFDVDEAPRYANLLDALQEAGLDVEWRDNDAGCKGVCARVRQITYSAAGNDPLCNGSYCYDEIMSRDLAAKLHELQRDTVIVMHQIGSHGPAYAERYPPAQELFKPACHSNQLQRCSSQEVVNAYDNSIVHTDRVLAQILRQLRDASDQVDSALLYVSDHGESLGEQGLYLHGLPYRFAPATQTHVPMLMWLSAGYRARGGVAMNCLQGRAAQAFSHDNFYHTALGLAEVRNRSYDAGLDILAGCRASSWPRDHE